MTAADCLQRYRDAVIEAESFITEAHTKDNEGNYIHPEAFRSFVVSSAVVLFSIAWESFLENIYCSFLIGEPDTQGRVVPCCVTAIDEDHAHRLLIGTNKYFDWTNPELVVKLSLLYLDNNNPLKTAINSANTDLFDLKNIRNAAAHTSSTTQKSLDSIASRLFGHQMYNTTVTEVISFTRPDGKNMWTYYKDLLDVAAENVANGQVI